MKKYQIMIWKDNYAVLKEARDFAILNATVSELTVKPKNELRVLRNLEHEAEHKNVKNRVFYSIIVTIIQ